MEKLKNFLYDKNDVLIAVLIIAAAVFIIGGRVEAIMAYPEVMAKQAEDQAQEDEIIPPTVDEGATEVDPDAAPDGAVDSGNGQQGTDSKQNGSTGQSGGSGDSGDSGDSTPAASIYIPTGSTWDSVANSLVSGGMITDKTAFLNAVHASGRENKLQLGNFIIPAGSTPAQIVNIVTGA